MCLFDKDNFFVDNGLLKRSQVFESTSVAFIQDFGVVPDSGSGKSACKARLEEYIWQFHGVGLVFHLGRQSIEPGH